MELQRWNVLGEVCLETLLPNVALFIVESPGYSSSSCLIRKKKKNFFFLYSYLVVFHVGFGGCRHRWTGRYEAHLWDKNCWNESQNKKGRQGSLSRFMFSCMGSNYYLQIDHENYFNIGIYDLTVIKFIFVKNFYYYWYALFINFLGGWHWWIIVGLNAVYLGKYHQKLNIFL